MNQQASNNSVPLSVGADASTLCLYASRLTAGSAQFGTLGVDLGAERRNARVYRRGFHHRTGRQDRSTLCLSRLAADLMRERNLAQVRFGSCAETAGRE
jgi:hypothetical protein